MSRNVKSSKLTRRSFIKSASLGLTALAASAGYLNANESLKKRPNIILCMADDWGWPFAPLYGDKVVKTPAFDRIAANGILFNNAFVTVPSCTPSRNSLLTGQYFWRLGSGANLWSQFPEGPETYPNILEDNGYFTGSFRKAFGPGADRPRPVAGKAFESAGDFFQNRPKDKPFCFWFGSTDPHRPYEWQSGIKSGMRLEDLQVPPCLPEAREIRTDICDYYWEIQRFDSEVGQALKIIEETGELDNTIVVMTGDNGWPFPRGKSNLYDLGVHVPLAVQWGDRINKGRVVDDFVSLADLAPTFLEAAGIEPLAEMTGRSLMNIFESSESGTLDPSRDHVLTGKERHTPAQADYMGGTPMRAIRNRNYLYIHNFRPDRWPAGDPDTSMWGPALGDIDDSPTKKYIVEHKNDPEVGKCYELCSGRRPADELYDLNKDPNQLNNVAGNPEYEKTVKELKAQLLEELRQTEDPRVMGQGDIFDTYPYFGEMRKESKR
ncbi:MAG TPA: sulfatase [Candidatus Glassbacteria bacterium]|nr:sulfatase [Candidatus Glassbacteria bacterium]